MTNIYKDPEKKERRDQLFNAAIRMLKEEGWTVSRVAGAGKSSLRRIVRGDRQLRVSIKTSQDQFIGFVPKAKGQGWETLDDVHAVIVASVDDSVPPREVQVHWFEATEVRARFDRAMKARTADGRIKPSGRGPWLPLYKKDDAKVLYVGGGLGSDYPPKARFALADVPRVGESVAGPSAADAVGAARARSADSHAGASSGNSVIIEAKRMIARGLNIPESAIRITIEA